MVSESWFHNFWKLRGRHETGFDKSVIGVLAFEVASLMSKVVHLWKSLDDKRIVRLREDVTNSDGIKKLISEDEEFVVKLICTEMMENMENMARSVARIAARCTDPSLKSFGSCFNELLKTGADPYGWDFGFKKMDVKVKKMERFVSVNASLYQEMEILADLEQTLKRMKCSDSVLRENLLEYHKKVSSKRHEVKNLREISLWNRTYDFTVLLLARSLFTIYSRIRNVFGISHKVETSSDLSTTDSDIIGHRQSVSGFSQSLGQKNAKRGLPRFASGPLGRFSATSASGPLTTRSTKMSDFLSGPLSSPSQKSGPIVAEKSKNKMFKFYSGPLGKLTSKSNPFGGMGKFGKKMWQTPEKSPVPSGKKHHSKHSRLTQVGPFKGCMVSQDGMNPLSTGKLNGARYSNAEDLLPVSNSANLDHSLSRPRSKLLDAPPDTLGAACLALQYANVITVIERFIDSPHLIGDDARDDLYSMLPARVRTSLRERLRPYAKNLSSSLAYDPVLAKEWTDAMAGILEWLAPLAHNMVKWQSERSYEHQSMVSRTNIVLIQTLYYANRNKTETAVTELLVGLNYVWRFGRELNAKALQECTNGRNFEKPDGS